MRLDIQKAITEGLETIRDEAKKSLEEKTPEDTLELIKSYKELPTEIKGGTTSTGVENDAPYIKYVEYGVEGKMYGYHKPKGKLFYVGVGAAMFARTKVEITPKVTQTLITNIRQAIKNHSKNHQGTK